MLKDQVADPPDDPASIEYGPLENATPLIVVLGHARCGAVTAAVRAIQSGEHLPGHLDAIVERLRPAYLKANSVPGDLIDQVVRTQILGTVSALAHDGPLAALVNRGELGIKADVCVRLPPAREGGRRTSRIEALPATWRDITDLGQRLLDDGVQIVVMEATSEYWRSWYYLLGAPRGAVYSCGDGRAPPPGRRSGLVKLEAA